MAEWKYPGDKSEIGKNRLWKPPKMKEERTKK